MPDQSLNRSSSSQQLTFAMLRVLKIQSKSYGFKAGDGAVDVADVRCGWCSKKDNPTSIKHFPLAWKRGVVDAEAHASQLPRLWAKLS